MEEEISLKELFGILKQKSKMIVFLSLLGLLLSGLYTFFLVTPMYESSSRIVVNQIQNTNQTITNNDIQTNLNLINTYQSIIKEPIILQEVLEETGSDLSIGDLREKINVQTEANSLVFGVSVEDPNPYVAAELANATAEVFRDKIGDILEVESVTVLSEAVPNVNAVSPNTVMNLALGLILGLMAGIGIAFLQTFMDKSIKGPEFIEQNIGWPNLGMVAVLSEKEKTQIARSLQQADNKPRRKRRVI